MQRLGQGIGTKFGSGWISGVLSVTFAAIGYGGVLCLLFPWLLTTPDARPLYPLPLVRLLIHALLVAGFGLGVLSALLRRRRPLGLTGIALALAAALVGGANAPVGAMRESPGYLGVDWFLLNLLLFALVFVPMERLFPRRAEQPIFRAGWPTDLGYFAVSHVLVQLTVLLTMAPAALLFAWAVRPGLQAVVAAQPLIVQFLEIVVAADLSEYAVHRLFHAVPWLWRFHRIHHSPARGCTWSTSCSPAGCRSCRSTCSASRRRRSTPISCSSRSTRSSSTPTCGSAWARSDGWW